MKPEVRTFSGVEVRSKDEAPGVEGYAAVFNQVTDLGWFKEKIAPGAFKRALSEKQDVRCLLNHDANIVLGRTANKTLELSEDKKGLKFNCTFPDTQAARDLHALLVRGDVDRCSFGFIVRKQSWTEEKLADGKFETTRIVEDADLFDVSPVTFPAYDQTSCEARSLWPEGMPAEVRSRVQEKRDDMCECECPECQDGDCEDCSYADCDDPNCEGHERSKPNVATKRVDGEDLPAAAFLIVGDPADIRSWKLPWKFSTDEKVKANLRGVLARFNVVKGVSEEQKSAAWTKLVSLCKEHKIEVTEEDSVRFKLTADQFAEFQPDTSEKDQRDKDLLQLLRHSL